MPNQEHASPYIMMAEKCVMQLLGAIPDSFFALQLLF